MNRAEQFALMQEMIATCLGLNNGSGIVFKIHRLEEIAKELTRTSWAPPEASFVEWVRREVIREAENNFRHDNTQHGTT